VAIPPISAMRPNCIYRNVHNTGDNLYTEADHLSSYSRIEAIDYHTTLTHAGISITPYHAGHVLGGAMFMVEIAGLKILFTGDYSREDDRHLVCAEVPPVKPDILICESTYGTASHMPRLEKEARLMKLTTEILQRGGRVLMPVFALGMAQELLLILDEYWEKYPKFQTFPIYYASNLARKCMDVYRTYINTMNDKIKRAMFEGEGRNPWDFKWVRSLKNIERFDDVGGCVMLASPGMLQVGPRFRSSYPIPSISSSYLGLQWCTEDWFTIAQWLLSSILYICFVSNLSDHVCVMKIYIIS